MTTMERNGSFIRGIETFSAFVGGVTGCLAIGLVIFKGGVLVEKVANHESRISGVEAGGTMSARSHIAVDEERDREMARQIAELRTAMLTISDLKADVKIMANNFVTLAASVSEMKETINGKGLK